MSGTTSVNKSDNSFKTNLHLYQGSHLGKYRLKERLGTGGTCEVWQARDSVEGIWVALKIPLAGAFGQRDNAALLREIRSVSRLRHPNILSVKNADIIDGHVVLATELSTGTLAECSRPMSVGRIMSIMVQVLGGLAHAHHNRIVHCDVTPANIFLFPDKRVALGDFGISLKLKGRVKTVEDFGTPGYVAPEQAYGHPTIRSDCFAAGLILYEYITGVLPRWSFDWPPRGYRRLCERTNLTFAKFLKKSLSVDPRRRFANAGKMLVAMLEAMPKSQLKKLTGSEKKESNWRKVRQQAFIKRYSKVFPAFLKCIQCSEPIAESMLVCPWCGSDRNRFDTRSRFDYICPRCHKGMLPQWRFCPWCYGAGFASQNISQSDGFRYQDRCKHCKEKIMRFMRYCPWCHRKIRHPWQVQPFGEICSRCGWSVDSSFWNYCPWCKQNLL